VSGLKKLPKSLDTAVSRKKSSVKVRTRPCLTKKASQKSAHGRVQEKKLPKTPDTAVSEKKCFQKVWTRPCPDLKTIKKPENGQNWQKVPFFSRIEIDSAQTLRAVLAGQRFWPNAKSVP
jgi:hypothetical protein